MSEEIRVVIVDDDNIVRHALSGYVDAAAETRVVGMCANGCEAITRAAQGDVDVMLMDVRMPGTDGVTVAKRIIEAHEAIKVIMLTTFDDDSILLAALTAGVHGFLLKDMPPQALTDAISLVHHGGQALPSRLARRITEEYLTQVPYPADEAPHEILLSERECAVLQALCEASSNSEIAKQLHISVSTVKSYLSTLMDKLAANSRLHVVIRAFELGLVPRPWVCDKRINSIKTSGAGHGAVRSAMPPSRELPPTRPGRTR